MHEGSSGATPPMEEVPDHVLWMSALEGDIDSLRELAHRLEPLDDEELGVGD